LLHVVLAYAMLYVSVRNELIELPPSISARLLPMIEEKQEPAKPLPPPPKEVRKQPVIRPQPVLAVASQTATSSFVVAPQPPAPPPQPIAAPPAPTPVAVVAARFDADYLHNPKPVYPALSRRLSEEGKVLLKVRVSAQGTALDVAVSKSSSFARLDAAAVEAVSRWRFVPARRGDEAVDSSVIVPITFALE
jgi:protein TonB